MGSAGHSEEYLEKLSNIYRALNVANYYEPTAKVKVFS
jgi:hypothetical protein